MDNDLNRKSSPNSSKGIIIALSVAVVVLIAVLVYALWQREDTQISTVSSFDECIAAGNPAMESQPRKCHDPISGMTFTEEIKNQDNPDSQASEDLSLTSEKGVRIELDSLQRDQAITSPFTLTGHVPGNWSFEANFPVELISSDGQVLATAPATMQGNWMTTDMAPFTVTLDFDASSAGDNGKLILRKANPSDLAENDDAVEVAVQFSEVGSR